MKKRRMLIMLLIVLVIIMTFSISAFASSAKPGKPKITSATVSGKNVTVKWNSAKKAKLYKLYSLKNVYSWEYFKTINADQKDNYSDKTKYKLTKQTKADGSAEYKVHKKKKTVKRKLLKTTKETTVKFKGQYGTTYRLSVRAFNGKAAGKYSSEKKVKIPKSGIYVFFGTDTRLKDYYIPGYGGYSDVIMLLRVNKKTKKIDILSVYRDTYLDIKGNVKSPRYSKCNWSFHDYSPEVAVKMLEQSLDIKIDGYVATNFIGVADAIDRIGKLNVKIEDDPVMKQFKTGDYKKYKFKKVPDVMNNYLKEMKGVYGSKYSKLDSTKNIKGTGSKSLNGLQAVSYARVRYTDGGDFRRTERQRYVFTQMYNKFKKKSKAQKIKILKEIYPNVQTNIALSPEEFADFFIPMMTYDIGKKMGFPFYKSNGTDKTAGYIVVPANLNKNVTVFHKRYMGEKSYTLSKNVKKYSAKIQKKTGVTYKKRNKKLDNK